MIVSALRVKSNSLKRALSSPRRACYSTNPRQKAPKQWWTWGSNDHGQLGHGELFEVQPKPIELESANKLGLDEISVGQNACVGRSPSTGESFVWGENHGGVIVASQSGDIVFPHKLPAASFVSAGWDSIWTIDPEGKLASSIGMRRATVDVTVGTRAKISKIVSSAYQTIFLKEDGSVLIHNDRKDAEFDGLKLDRGVASVVRGWSHFLFLDLQGDVWAVGANKHGQLGLGHSETVQIPTLISSLRGTKIKQIASGATHSMALTESGKVLIWGSHKDGKLGLDTDRDHLDPVELKFFSDKEIVMLAGGCDHSAAISKSGDIYTWGFGQHGALGLGGLHDAPTPQKVEKFQPANARIVDVQCGMDATFVQIQL